MIRQILFCFILSGSSLAEAAIDRSGKTAMKVSDVNHSILLAIRLPFENRIQALKELGPQGLVELERLAFDESQTLSIRWKSLTSLARLQGPKGLKVLEKAIARPEWFMRNAAVVASVNLDRRKALEWSRQLLSDEALVVRTAAVQNLVTLGSRGEKDLLWKELNAPRNFRAGKSLWIRRHIAKALSDSADSSDSARFAKMLQDQDARLHAWAVVGLERSTGQLLGVPGSPIKQKRQLWMAQMGLADSTTQTQ